MKTTHLCVWAVGPFQHRDSQLSGNGRANQRHELLNQRVPFPPRIVDRSQSHCTKPRRVHARRIGSRQALLVIGNR